VITNTEGRRALWGWVEQVLREKRLCLQRWSRCYRIKICRNEKWNSLERSEGRKKKQELPRPVGEVSRRKAANQAHSEWKVAGANNFASELSYLVRRGAILFAPTYRLFQVYTTAWKLLYIHRHSSTSNGNTPR
jgi:hypothetical protein